MEILSEFDLEDYRILTIKIPKNVSIKEVRSKRSRNANNYFWELLQQLCENLHIDTIGEYKRRVKQLGIFRTWEVEATNVNTFKIMWQDKGIGWFIDIVDTFYKDEKEYKVIHAYYGSSSYNSKQMAMLIDDLVDDCKELGIETKTPEELAKLENYERILHNA